MGMMFGGWIKEEEEKFKVSGLTKEEFEKKEDYERNNFVYRPLPKKARFRGIELCVGDIIAPSIEKQYIIVDFQDNAIPIVTLISREKHEYYNKPYEFDTLLVYGASL